MVPDILDLVIASWQEIPAPAPHSSEDQITYQLCRALRRNRNARGLPFRIDPQAVELDPLQPAELGRMDITFSPPINREAYYFCLESKRLNVIRDENVRSYASEYVTFGMLRFITGQYAKEVRHGGMLAYVLDGDIGRAINNVESNIRNQHDRLGMTAPGRFETSSVLPADSRVRETRHRRPHEPWLFRIHHLFMAVSVTTR